MPCGRKTRTRSSRRHIRREKITAPTRSKTSPPTPRQDADRHPPRRNHRQRLEPVHKQGHAAPHAQRNPQRNGKPGRHRDKTGRQPRLDEDIQMAGVAAGVKDIRGILVGANLGGGAALSLDHRYAAAVAVGNAAALAFLLWRDTRGDSQE